MTDRRWQTHDSGIAYTCDGFDIVNETVELPDGTRTEFDYLSENPSVVVLPFTTTGEVVVIDEWRHAVKRDNRGLPAGSLEEDEDPAEGVTRELGEETGYEPGDVTHLTTVEPANGFSDAVFHYYVATDCQRTGEQRLDDDESIRVRTDEYESLLADLREGRLRDGRSAFAVLYYELFENR